MIKITFPDGSVKEYPKGTTPYRIAESISPRLAADILVATVNGSIHDLERPIVEDATIKLHKWEDQEAKAHSGTHQAILWLRLSRYSIPVSSLA